MRSTSCVCADIGRVLAVPWENKEGLLTGNLLQTALSAAAAVRVLKPMMYVKSSPVLSLVCTNKRRVNWAKVTKQATPADLDGFRWAVSHPSSHKFNPQRILTLLSHITTKTT